MRRPRWAVEALACQEERLHQLDVQLERQRCLIAKALNQPIYSLDTGMPEALQGRIVECFLPLPLPSHRSERQLYRFFATPVATHTEADELEQVLEATAACHCLEARGSTCGAATSPWTALESSVRTINNLRAVSSRWCAVASDGCVWQLLWWSLTSQHWALPSANSQMTGELAAAEEMILAGQHSSWREVVAMLSQTMAAMPWRQLEDAHTRHPRLARQMEDCTGTGLLCLQRSALAVLVASGTACPTTQPFSSVNGRNYFSRAFEVGYEKMIALPSRYMYEGFASITMKHEGAAVALMRLMELYHSARWQLKMVHTRAEFKAQTDWFDDQAAGDEEYNREIVEQLRPARSKAPPRRHNEPLAEEAAGAGGEQEAAASEQAAASEEAAASEQVPSVSKICTVFRRFSFRVCA